MAERRQAGAALTESLILLVPMLLVYFWIPTLGKLAEVRHAGQLASRYLAWEHTVREDTSRISDFRDRFFDSLWNGEGGKHTGPTSVAVSSTGSAAAHDAEEDDPLAVRISFSRGAGQILRYDTMSSGIARSSGRGVVEAGEILSHLDGAEWTVAGDGMTRADVRVNVRSSHILKDDPVACDGSRTLDMFGCIESHTVILTDGWSSGSAEQAENHTRAWVPGTFLRPFGHAVSKLGDLPVFKELKQLDNAFGYVDAEVLPRFGDESSGRTTSSPGTP